MKIVDYTITTDGAPFSDGKIVTVWINPYQYELEGDLVVMPDAEAWPGAIANKDELNAPFGDSYWNTLTEAYDFVMQVKLQYEQLPKPGANKFHDHTIRVAHRGDEPIWR